MIEYGFVKVSDRSFDDALQEVQSKLKGEGFGILTRINVHEKFQEKLNIDFPRYVILGACNPPSAYEAIQALTAHDVESSVPLEKYQPDVHTFPITRS